MLCLESPLGYNFDFMGFVLFLNSVQSRPEPSPHISQTFLATVWFPRHFLHRVVCLRTPTLRQIYSQG